MMFKFNEDDMLGFLKYGNERINRSKPSKIFLWIDCENKIIHFMNIYEHFKFFEEKKEYE